MNPSDLYIEYHRLKHENERLRAGLDAAMERLGELEDQLWSACGLGPVSGPEESEVWRNVDYSMTVVEFRGRERYRMNIPLRSDALSVLRKPEEYRRIRQRFARARYREAVRVFDDAVGRRLA